MDQGEGVMNQLVFGVFNDLRKFKFSGIDNVYKSVPTYLSISFIQIKDSKL